MLIPAFVIRSSIVLLAGFAAATLLRRQPAALRHSMLAAAVMLAAAQPAITRLIPTLTVPALRWTAAAPAAPDTAVAVETVVAPDLSTTVPATAVPSVDRSRIALVVWMAGIACTLAMLLVGVAWLGWLQWRSSDAGDEWLEIHDRVLAQLGGTRRARIALTQHPALVVTWGVVSPAILLPSSAGTWSADRKRLVIAHELAHVQRRDWLIQFVAEAVRSLYWFNPLFWIACARLRRESEHASDDLVLDTGITGTSYASHLLDMARTLRRHGRTWLPAPSMARLSTLEGRVRAMLNPQINRRRVSRGWRFALVVLLSAIALPIAAAAQAQDAPAGTVTDRTGRPLADATLRLVGVNGGEPIETRSDANGLFQFPRVPAGEYMLSIRQPGFSSSRRRLQVSGGGTTIQLQAEVGTLQERVTIDQSAVATGARQTDEVSMPAPQACSAAPTGGQIIPPMKIRDVRPRYKQEWRDAHLEGEILLKATLAADGTVRGVDVISPVHAELEDEAAAAVSLWRFTPTYLNCEPIEVQMYVTVSFRLQ